MDSSKITGRIQLFGLTSQVLEHFSTRTLIGRKSSMSRQNTKKNGESVVKDAKNGVFAMKSLLQILLNSPFFEKSW